MTPFSSGHLDSTSELHVKTFFEQQTNEKQIELSPDKVSANTLLAIIEIYRKHRLRRVHYMNFRMSLYNKPYRCSREKFNRNL